MLFRSDYGERLKAVVEVCGFVSVGARGSLTNGLSIMGKLDAQRETWPHFPGRLIDFHGTRSAFHRHRLLLACHSVLQPPCTFMSLRTYSLQISWNTSYSDASSRPAQIFFAALPFTPHCSHTHPRWLAMGKTVAPIQLYCP